MLKKIFGKKNSSNKNAKTEEEILALIDRDRLPKHVAVIMDGNGRWASGQGMVRSAGHASGVKTLKTILRAAVDLKIEAFTVYAFSTENWKRPTAEVEFLMKLFADSLARELDEMDELGIRIKFIGRLDGFSPYLQEQFDNACRRTANNTGVKFNVAVNYGGQDEMLRVMQSLAKEVQAGNVAPDDIDVSMIEERLDTAGVSPVDLVIRTSGDMRLSNFLIWQTAYAELWFTDTNWPDFTKAEFYKALLDFSQRDRRFGGLSKKK
ncbi:Undecaprenyl pyrophosphate synthetase [Anaerovibrio sp. JC8]|uniref:polyprenyl diphosphate synthase n=1 Tax=Anaerovibrio sp. JC8 TaxID=1240085 RepID=UPI000A0DF34A|nr:polyprenyl diphosphate synthase [Anaerovibrio sp. JC8]ORU01238.1 Undecaprenyl pyrophosphate synthetase [Anaerovibrio sp. JC8]